MRKQTSNSGCRQCGKIKFKHYHIMVPKLDTDEYWINNPPKREGYNISTITPAIARIPYSIPNTPEFDLHSAFFLDNIKCLGDLILIEEKEFLEHKGITMMHVRKIKRVLAAHGLHLAWSKDTRDNPPEIERYSEGLKMILKEVAENTNRTEEQVWKTVRRGAAILGITNDDASVAMLIHPVKKHDSKPSE